MFAGPAATPTGASPRCACPRAARSSRASRSTTTPRSSRATAPRAWPTSRSTSAQRARGIAVADRQVPLGCRRRRDLSSAPVRRRGDLVFFGADNAQDRQRRPGRAAAQGRPRPRAGRGRLAAAVGRRLPDVRMGRRREALRGAAPPVHRAGSDDPRRCEADPGARSRGLRHGAERHRDRRRFDPHPPQRDAADGVRRCSASARRRPRRSSASCSTRSSTARRRTAASPSASTAWSC